MTDIGTRVIVAIRTTQNWEPVAEGWLKGPPYTVAEHVFNETEFKWCYPSEEAYKKAY